MSSSVNYIRWMPDSNSEHCLLCQKSFSFFYRRHHCRQCGLLVCWQCSNNKSVIVHFSENFSASIAERNRSKTINNYTKLQQQQNKSKTGGASSRSNNNSNNNSNSRPAPPPSGKFTHPSAEPQRVCDKCFKKTQNLADTYVATREKSHTIVQPRKLTAGNDPLANVFFTPGNTATPLSNGTKHDSNFNQEKQNINSNNNSDHSNNAENNNHAASHNDEFGLEENEVDIDFYAQSVGAKRFTERAAVLNGNNNINFSSENSNTSSSNSTQLYNPAPVQVNPIPVSVRQAEVKQFQSKPVRPTPPELSEECVIEVNKLFNYYKQVEPQTDNYLTQSKFVSSMMKLKLVDEESLKKTFQQYAIDIRFMDNADSSDIINVIRSDKSSIHNNRINPDRVIVSTAPLANPDFDGSKELEAEKQKQIFGLDLLGWTIAFSTICNSLYPPANVNSAVSRVLSDCEKAGLLDHIKLFAH